MPKRKLEDILGMCRRWLRCEKGRVNWFGKMSIFLRGGPNCPKFGPIIKGSRGYKEKQKLAPRVHFLALEEENAKRTFEKITADLEKGGKIDSFKPNRYKMALLSRSNFRCEDAPPSQNVL